MRFTRRTLLLSIAILPGAVQSVHIAAAQPYPVKPLRMLTAGFGGGSDIAARLLAQGMSESLGQQVVVDNRVGGITIAHLTTQAPPDGYTLLTYSNSLWLLPLMHRQPPYDPVRDFTPVSLIGGSVFVLVTHPAVPVKSVAELIALVKAKPGELNYATGPSGAIPHLAGELFKHLAGLKITQVAYRSVGAAVTDVIGGRVQIMFPNASAALPHAQTGRLRVLAVTSAQPSALAPGLPTLAQAGLPGFACTSYYATLAPPKTPPQIVQRISREIAAVLKRADMREKFLAASTEIHAGTPEELRAAITDEMARFATVIKAANIQLD